MKNSYLKGKFGRNRPMKRRHLINGCDEALFDRNGVIISHPSDQQSKIRMRPRLQVKGRVVSWSSVGSSANDRDVSKNPSIASDLSCYNSQD